MKSRQRFSSALPVLSAFAVFDVMMVPPPESVNFKEYGLKHIETLAKLNIFTSQNVVQAMLQALMQVSINGPPLHSDQCKELVRDSAQLWLKQKKRRTLAKKGASTDHRGSVCEQCRGGRCGSAV